MILVRKFAKLFLLISFAGFIDATYLTIKHYQGGIVPCSNIGECERVLSSEYSVIFGIPVALFGALYYLTIFMLSISYIDLKKTYLLSLVAYLTPLGFLASAYFIYIQLFVIKSLCLFCLFSALTSFALFVLGVAFIVKYKSSLTRRV